MVKTYADDSQKQYINSCQQRGEKNERKIRRTREHHLYHAVLRNQTYSSSAICHSIEVFTINNKTFPFSWLMYTHTHGAAARAWHCPNTDWPFQLTPLPLPYNTPSPSPLYVSGVTTNAISLLPRNKNRVYFLRSEINSAQRQKSVYYSFLDGGSTLSSGENQTYSTLKQTSGNLRPHCPIARKTVRPFVTVNGYERVYTILSNIFISNWPYCSYYRQETLLELRTVVHTGNKIVNAPAKHQ